MERTTKENTTQKKESNESQNGGGVTTMSPPEFSLNASAVQMKPAQEKGTAQMKEGEMEDPLKVDQGQLTFDAEGNDNAASHYYTRVVHWPGGVSGVTIGRGYDLGGRSKDQVMGHLTAAGVPAGQASKIAGGAGLKGKPAGDFVTKNKKSIGEISAEQQNLLFQVVYEEHKQDVVRLSSKKDVVAAYGETDFDSLHPAIMDMLVDLRYRGDYHSRSRKWIQSMVAKNDLKGLAAAMADERWIKDFGVPKDRFERRKKYMADALAGKKGDLSGKDKEPAKDQDSGAAESTKVIGTGTVNASSLNVRTGPGTTFGTTGTPLKGGANVTIYQKADGWYQIGSKMWVSAKYVDFTEKKETPKSDSPIDSGTISANALNVRKGPSASFEKVGEPLKQGTSVKVYESKDGWLRIGKDQWVSGKFVQLTGKKDEAPAKEETQKPKDEPKKEAPTSKGTVSSSSLNVRNGIGTSASKVDTLKQGDVVTIYEEKDGWMRIGPDRWVSGKYISKGNSGQKPQGSSGKGVGPKPNWVSIAESEIGQKEVKGSKHNSRIIEYHSTTGKFSDDETPWCASFVNWVFGKAGVSATGSARALSFENWGKKLDKPAYGSVAVFSWGGGKGHVGFVVGEQGGKLLVLGGNQADSVKVSAFAKTSIVAYVVPGDYNVPGEAYNLSGSGGEVEDGGGMSATR